MLTEFRNHATGQRLRDGLHEIGLVYQSDRLAQERVNSVLIASRTPMMSSAVEACGDLRHRCVMASIDDIRVLGVYFPNKQAKKPLYDSLLGFEAEYRAQPAIIIGDFNTGRHFVDEPGKTFY